MSFNFDIYISYAISDNLESSDSQGWVSNFKKFLNILLIQILGDEPVFLNYANQEKPNSSQLAQTAILICIVSPNYIQNEACVEEINDFVNQTSSVNNINDVNRIFKVIKFPVDNKNQPSKIQNLLSYELYETNIQSREVSEITNFFNTDAERNYWLKLIDIAYEIAAQIKKIRNLTIHKEQFNIYNPKTVYLAEAGLDLQLHRDNIKRELIRYGFNVLPNRSLPSNTREMELAIKSDLEKSRLSVHLIGDSYGEQPLNSEKSILDIQNKLASEHSGMNNAMHNGSNKFNRLIWISPSAQLNNDKQKIFVDNLRRDLEQNEGAEILQSPIEDFKMLILEELLGLNQQSKKRHENIAITQANKVFYLIYDSIDGYDANKLVSVLRECNIDLILSAFEGNLLTLREKHLENLQQCDGAIIYVNKVNDLWVQMKYLDLLKAPGLGRVKNDIQKFLIYGKLAKERLSNFEKFDVTILDQNNNNFNNSFLNFLNKV